MPVYFSHFFVSCIAEATWNVFCLPFIFLWSKFYCLWIVPSWQRLRPKAFFPAAQWNHNKKQLRLQLPHNVKPLCLSPDLVGGQLSPSGVSRLWHQLLRCLTVSRQGSLLIGVNLPWNLKPHNYERAGLCGSHGCVLSPRWKASGISKLVPFFIKLPSEPERDMDLRWLVVFYLICSKSCAGVQSKNSLNGQSSHFLAW